MGKRVDTSVAAKKTRIGAGGGRGKGGGGGGEEGWKKRQKNEGVGGGLRGNYLLAIPLSVQGALGHCSIACLHDCRFIAVTIWG